MVETQDETVVILVQEALWLLRAEKRHSTKAVVVEHCDEFHQDV
jgi:hypothetical protein